MAHTIHKHGVIGYLVSSRCELPARVLAILLFLLATSVHAKHVAPPEVLSITSDGVRYVVPHDQGLRGYVEAWDVQTGRKLWSKTIFKHWYIPPFGTENMRYEYLGSMTLVKEELLLTSDRGRAYALNFRTRTVRRVASETSAP